LQTCRFLWERLKVDVYFALLLKWRQYLDERWLTAAEEKHQKEES
jgi:hypothetical protein